jgi:hypothetical protein
MGKVLKNGGIQSDLLQNGYVPLYYACAMGQVETREQGGEMEGQKVLASDG